MKKSPDRSLALLIGIGIMATLSSHVSGTTAVARDTHGRNQIEVTGNRSGSVQVACEKGRSARVNSVDVDRQSLEGTTVIVAGRNSVDVDTRDCKDQQGDQDGTTNINSIRIR